MDSVDCIDMVERFINRISENYADAEKVTDLLLGLNKTFSVMTPNQKTTVLDWLVGRLIESRYGK
jgi:hypothetical protein